MTVCCARPLCKLAWCPSSKHGHNSTRSGHRSASYCSRAQSYPSAAKRHAKPATWTGLPRPIGLPLGIGTKAQGEGLDRIAAGVDVLPRNTLALWGRGGIGFETFFWDGKVEVVDETVRSQFGDQVMSSDPWSWRPIFRWLRSGRWCPTMKPRKVSKPKAWRLATSSIPN